MNDFRSRLRQELVDRCKKNPRYSLRTFAAQLGLDASTLSKVLNGKRPIGKKTMLSLGSKIGLSAAELTQSLQMRELAKNGGATVDPGFEFQALAMDQFTVISEWYHFAILELMQVEGFRTDRKWIAKALGLNQLTVDLALERLARVGMLEVLPNGKWKDISAKHTTAISPDMTTSAQRRLQEQFLEKAIEALNRVPIRERDHTSMTMAADRSRLPEARERIKRFRRSLARFLSEGEKLDEVLNLNIALFPLTNLNERKIP
jgi:uncharacterized protein (TIGR02147 family)